MGVAAEGVRGATDVPPPSARRRGGTLALDLWLGLPALASAALALLTDGADDWYAWTLVFALAAGLFLVLGVRRLPAGPPAVAGAAFVALAALTLASTAWALLAGPATVEGARLLLYASCFLLVLALVRSHHELRTLTWLVAASSGIVSAYGIATLSV